jgi:hypothetical protein
MAFEHREGWGSFRKNRYKEENDKKPDLTGDGMYNGEVVRIAVWRKVRDDGSISFSFNLQPKEQKPLEDKQPRRLSDDDIPF